MEERSSIFKSIFRLGYNRDRKSPVTNTHIYPTDFVTQQNQYGKDVTKEVPVRFDPKVRQLFQQWLNNAYENRDTLEDRFNRYNDQEEMYYSSDLISRTVDLICDEALQADSNMQIIGVDAEPKQRDFILQFLKEANVESKARDTIFNFLLTGDAGWILIFGEHGIEEIKCIDPYDLQERIEFTPAEVNKQLNEHNSTLYQMSTNFERINGLIDKIKDEESFKSYYKNYLFGFQVGYNIIPPWRFVHFRNYTSKSPFTPYGVPTLIHCLAPYRQLEAAKTLMVTARGANFPIEKLKLTLTNVMGPTQKLNKALELLREFDNSGMGQTAKENKGIGEKMIEIAGLYEYDVQSPNINIGDIGDLEMLENALIRATGLPRGIVDVNSGVFGNGGESLVQQFKPFARLVYRIQQVFLQGLTQAVKIHMIQSGEFELKDINFTLTMPYPESQTNRDIIGSQNDLIGLVNSILDLLGNRVLGDSSAVLPPELVKQVMYQVMPYDDDRIDKWVKMIIDARASASEQGDGEEQLKESRQKIRLVEKNLLKEAINEFVAEGKKKHLREGVISSRHYYHSDMRDNNFDLSILEESKNKELKKLMEEFKVDELKNDKFSSYYHKRNKLQEEIQEDQIDLGEEEPK
jgi:autonomous glycyl radical cofactor GrcA